MIILKETNLYAMKITTNSRYSLRIMIDLCLHSEQGPVFRQAIAERQDIPSEYIAQLCRRLVKAGLIRSVKGPGGGYLLAKPAAEITAAEIYRSVEGSISPRFCTQRQKAAASPCKRIESCPTHLLWEQLSRIMASYLDSVTLQDLCNSAKALENRQLAFIED